MRRVAVGVNKTNGVIPRVGEAVEALRRGCRTKEGIALGEASSVRVIVAGAVEAETGGVNLFACEEVRVGGRAGLCCCRAEGGVGRGVEGAADAVAHHPHRA